MKAGKRTGMIDQDSFLPNLEVRVIAFSLREERLHVLLVSAGSTPSPLWEIPGGRILKDQSLEEAASQQLNGLTGLRETYLEQLYTYGEAGRGGKDRVISVVYFALLPAGAVASPAVKDDVSIRWFPVDVLPPLVEDHREVLAYALRRLRYKLEYTAVGFQLLPEAFTLSDLQQTYEMILGEQLDKRNFRRRILEAQIIEPTGTLRTGEGRPARLYRYRPDAVAEIKARRLFP